jgi:hypothetical protein
MGRQAHRAKDKKTDLQEIQCGGLFGQSPVADSCERGNETSGYIKDRELVDQLGDYKLLKNDGS